MWPPASPVWLSSCTVFEPVRPHFNPRLFIGMVKFGIPIGVGAIASFVINFGDQLILPRYISTTELGDYVLAYKIAMLIYAFVFTPFQTHWSAQIFIIMKRDDSQVVFSRLLTYLSSGLAFCAIGLVTCSALVLRVIPASYRGAYPIIPVIVFAYCARALGEFVRGVFTLEGHPGYDAIVNWMGALICFAGYFGLIPIWGIWGAAIATAIAFVLVALISFYWTWRLRPYRPEFRRLGKIGVATIAATVLYHLIPAVSLGAQAGAAALALITFPGVIAVNAFLDSRRKGSSSRRHPTIAPRRITSRRCGDRNRFPAIALFNRAGLFAVSPRRANAEFGGLL